MFIKKIWLILLSVISLNIYTEFLLYKVDSKKPDKIGLLSYETLNPKEQEELWHLYQSTVYRYSWPTVTRFFNPSNFYPKFEKQQMGKYFLDVKPIVDHQFSPREAKEYLKALQIVPCGLFDFIKNKIEKQSNQKYSLFWVPTAIFELFTLYNITSQEAILYDNPNLKLMNPSVASTFARYCNTIDTIIKKYKIDDKVVTVYDAQTKSYVDMFVQELGNSIGATFENVRIPAYPKYWASKIFSVLKKYLVYEQIAFNQNQFILSRGTEGYKDTTVTQNMLAVDYGLREFSYGNSLFAGVFFDSSIHGNQGAQSLMYMMPSAAIGYIILVDIKDFFTPPYTLAYLFALPPLSTLQGLFGIGENFHVSVNNLKEIPISKLSEITLAFARYLSAAQIISLGSDFAKSKDILHNDIVAQQAELINKTVQILDSVKSEELFEWDTLLMMWDSSLKSQGDDKISAVVKN